MAEFPSPQVFFNSLDKDHIDMADRFYDPKVSFEDPLGRISGLSALKAYYARMYENVLEIRFDFSNEVWAEAEYVGFWQMTMRLKNFNSQKPMKCSGNSYIRFSKESSKAIYHRDYFDMGEFIYEYLPLIGAGIRFAKSRLKNQMHKDLDL